MNKKLFTNLVALSFLFVGCAGVSSEPISSSSQTTSEEQQPPLENPYGELIIEDMTLYLSFPDKPFVTFTNPEYACEITYTILESDYYSIEEEDGYFSSKRSDYALVEATTQYHTTTFEIEAKRYNGISDWYLNKVTEKENYWKNNGAQKGGTVFIGDSFFDTEFWSNFYTTYKGNNAYTTAISSSTIKDWEVFSSRLLYPLEPENVVVHCGTNDLWDDKESAEVVSDNIQRYFDTVHKRLPDANIYWFAIEPRSYAMSNFGLTFDLTSYEKLVAVNASMEEYCSQNDFVTYLDATSNCYTTPPSVNTSFFRDGTHPTLANYMIYVYMLQDAGLDLVINDTSNTTEIDIPLSGSISSTNTNIKKNNQALVKEYAVSGKLKISSIGFNPHIQLSFDDTNFQNRFLLWDPQSSNGGTLKLGYACNGAHISNVGKASVTANQEVSWELVVSAKHAYLYINNALELIFLNLNPSSALIVGAENCAVRLYDIVVNSDYASVLARSEISTYENSTNTAKTVVVA